MCATLHKRDTLHTRASYLSRPLFEKYGFVVEFAECPVRHGMTFKRFAMVKQLK